MNSWKVLMACGSKKDVVFSNYVVDKSFSPKHYAFFNLGKEPFSSVNGFEVVNSSEIPGYVRLGRKYAESELIYNVFKLGLFRDCSWLGLMHCDFKFLDQTSMSSNVTELIDSCISSGSVNFISFFTGTLFHLVGPYNVLLDERKPNCLFVKDSLLQDPKSINSRIIGDLKRILKTDLDLKSFPLDAKVALCCSFLSDRQTFDEIGKLLADAIEDGYFRNFDLQDKHRFPGQAAERYVALYSLLKKRKACMSLQHMFAGGREDLRKDPKAENY